MIVEIEEAGGLRPGRDPGTIEGPGSESVFTILIERKAREFVNYLYLLHNKII